MFSARMRRLLNSLRVVVLASVLAAGAWGAGQSEIEVVWGLESGSLTLDPAMLGGPPDNQFYYLIFDGLVQRPDFFNPDGSLPPFEPLLAHSWDLSDDGLVWTFYLHEGVRFHGDYGVMTAHDVKFTFDRASTLQRSYEFSFVREVNVIDDHTVEFHLEEPFSPFLFFLATQISGSIVSQKAVEELGDDAFASNPIGTGPYRLASWESGGPIEVVAFDDHWRGRPEVDRVRVAVIPDQSVQALALLNGEIHKMRLRDQTVFDRVAGQPGVQIVAHPAASFGSWELELNTTRAPLDDRRVRHALLHAIDRDAIFDAFVGDTGVGVAHSIVRPSNLGHLSADQLPSYGFDLELARSLLAEAGYADGFTISVLALPQQLMLDILTNVQATWAEIGVTLEIDVNERARWQQRLNEGDYDIKAGDTTRAETDQLLAQYHSGNTPASGGNNYSFFADPRVDELIALQRAEADTGVRAELVGEIQRIVMDELPVLPVYYSRHVTGISDRFDVTDNVFIWYFKVDKWQVRD